MGSTRFLGTTLLMLLFSLLQLVSAKPAPAMLEAKDDRHITIDFSFYGSMVSIRGESDPDTDTKYRGLDRTDPLPPVAINKDTHTSVFYRLKPGIFLVPRMNRTPKPKSVYRLFARAPGEGISSSLSGCMDYYVHNVKGDGIYHVFH
ncbi:MAG TPA: hypothetical protein VL197_09510 [Nitrospirota bacterium]|nr:hypothetical protein [Nitrospirota bacterium]